MGFTACGPSLLTRVGLVTIAMLFAPATSHAQDQRNIWVLNNTGRTINSLNVSPHENTRWGEDVLGRATLPDGMGTVIAFDSSIETSCTMDFRLVFKDGSEQTYEQGRDVCILGAVQFNRSTSIGLMLPD